MAKRREFLKRSLYGVTSLALSQSNVNSFDNIKWEYRYENNGVTMKMNQKTLQAASEPVTSDNITFDGAKRAIRTALPDSRIALNNIIDQFTGESVQLVKVVALPSGVNVDGIIYFQTDTLDFGVELWKRSYTGGADVRWWGVAADGVTDDSSLFQQAVNTVSELHIPKGVYKIANPINIPSYHTICGEGDSVLLAEFTVESTGGFPNTLIQIENAQSISFWNVVFDWGRDVLRSASGAGLTMNPGITVDSSSEIIFTNCTFRNYLSNRDSDKSGLERALRWVMASFNESQGITLDRCKSSYVREEQFTFVRCQAITVNSFSGNGAGGLSTQLAYWYCDNVYIANSSFVQNSGSVINVYSTNVLISNISINRSASRWGRGIDIGNELGVDQDFVPGNITIENSYFNCFSYGVASSLGSVSEQHVISNVVIRNNTFLVNQQGGGGLTNFQRCVIVTNPRNWCIENNYVNLRGTTAVSQGVFVYFIVPAVTSSDELGSVTVSGNTVHSNTFMSIPFPTTGERHFHLDAIYITKNSYTAIVFDGFATQSGARQFVYLRCFSTSIGSLSVDTIILKDNDLRDVSGYYCEFMQGSGDVLLSIDRLVIDNNTVKPIDDESLTENFRTRLLNRFSSSLVFTNNLILRPGISRAANFDKVQMYGNIFDGASKPLTGAAFEIENVNTLVDVKDNKFLGQSSSVETIEGIGVVVPSIVNTRNNVALDQSGVLFFNTNLLNTQDPNGFNQSSAQVDSVATDTTGIVSDFNTLLDKLRVAGIIAE